MLVAHGGQGVPRNVAELGPGDSVGVGLAALLSGSENYLALDVVPFADRDRNLEVLDELVELFKSRARSPATGFPNFWRYLNEDLFPDHILTEGLLSDSLSRERLDAIRHAVRNPGVNCDGICFRYVVPWTEASLIKPNSVDYLLSHSVLEHVSDLRSCYSSMNRWLKKGGFCSHQIDFSSHGLSKTWNGYRGYSELLWRAMLGKRHFLINREPPSRHRELFLENGFELLFDAQNIVDNGIERSRLAKQWRDISDDDLYCNTAFFVALKR
jgi:hypothetical protein